mgnify:CR=1 FL=1
MNDPKRYEYTDTSLQHSDDELDTLNALGIVFPTKQGRYQVALAHLSVGVSLLDLGFGKLAFAIFG